MKQKRNTNRAGATREREHPAKKEGGTMTRKFWNWVRNEEPDSFGSDRTLYLDGEISDETWFGDEVTPKLFKDELNAGDGNITLWINSPGGDVFAAAQIYNMLMDYPHDVTVKIDALAASAASSLLWPVPRSA
jgi:ATP-dependent Clp protease, protease subunit